MTLTLGFSPCPNDTFIFDALVNGRLDIGDLRFEPVLEDVETLNRWAAAGKLHLTKLSYSAFLHLTDRYALLRAGSALGRGVGPLLLSRAPLPIGSRLDEWLSTARVAIPGKQTTANLLLTLAFPDAANKTEVLFSDIERAVLAGDFDAGLVIHESRFTYAARGLRKLLDLGDWWERETGAAIPLGGICARRDLPIDVIQRVDNLLRQSIEDAWERHPQLSPYVVEHAQEMDEAVMRQHIALYVNDHTTGLAEEGERAVETLFEKAVEAGVITGQPEKIFA
jgi:1,4-dihydroxy-6-naphthoate synthase